MPIDGIRGGKLLEVSATGRLSKEDYEHFEPAVSGLSTLEGAVAYAKTLSVFSEGC